MAFPKALLIDMDDTLFPERAYVESGFQAVAQFLEETRDLPADYSLPSMLAFLELEGRGAIFDRIIERFEIRNSDGLVPECVEVYRGHKPSIAAYEGVQEALGLLNSSYDLALVTNGHPMMQRQKLEALALEPYFQTIVYCDDIGAPKPSKRGLELALDTLGVAAEDCVFVGDNPDTDGLAALAAGVPFLRVRSKRFAAIDMQAKQVSTFAEVPDYLETSAHTLRL